jgi:carbon storage regulator
MLILTRKSNESVIVGNNIEIRVLEVRGDQVRIGFSAPSNIPIYRKEVHEAIQHENAQAAGHGAHRLEAIGLSLGRELAQTLRTAKERKSA